MKSEEHLHNMIVHTGVLGKIYLKKIWHRERKYLRTDMGRDFQYPSNTCVLCPTYDMKLVDSSSVL